MQHGLYSIIRFQEWLQDTFGKDNVVSAVLHMDEKTPHIHATVVPIVTGKRRKAEAEKNNSKKREKDVANVKAYLDNLRKEYEPLKTQEELNTIHKYFPLVKEQLRIVDFCEKIGLAFESIKSLLSGKTLTASTFKLYSPGYDRHFEAKDLRLRMEKEPDNPEKLRLNLNGENILDWFKQKYQELKQVVRPHIKPPTKPEIGRNKGIKM